MQLIVVLPASEGQEAVAQLRCLRLTGTDVYIIIIIIIFYLSDKQHTECRSCSAKQKAYWSLYIVKKM